jgi:serine/threonine protein kinase/Tol biopolymer transport system component
MGPYEILGAVGAGGMGEVYRGRDTRLGRLAAIKVLPEAVAHDAERLARFEREAQTLAALNHPNIAQIYGLEGGALAMEFVEGEDLSARIARGVIPVDDALVIAAQIAGALESAHEFGIIHRDLKPSNIRIREDGAVKVLDFGLAKALAPPSSLLGTSSGSTVASPAVTHQGVILGTAAYMSPEQARGKPADKRADIWAFGAVLYEMITGRRPFEGESVTESLASVIKSEPDWAPVPLELRRLLRSCLEKDPKERLRDIGDWRRQIDGAPAAVEIRAKRSWLAWSVAALAAVAAGTLAVAHFLESPAPAPPLTFHVPPPGRSTFETALSVSPDGTRIAFTAKDPDETVRIWIRDLASIEARPVAGTEGARNVSWSPDGRAVAFAAGRVLKRVPVDGGSSLTLHEAESVEALGQSSWNRHGTIIFGGFRAGAIRRVSESGGVVTALTQLDATRQELAHGLPSFLPDGRHFLYTCVSADPDKSGVFVGSIDRTPDAQDRTRLLAAPRAVHTSLDRGAGALLYLRQSTLVAHDFDVTRLALVGEPRPIAEGVGNFGSLGFFSAGGGVIAYRSGTRVSGGRESQLTWYDRAGTVTGVVGATNAYDEVSLSPDGTRAAVVLASLADAGLGNLDIWVVDLSRGLPQRLTSNPATERGATWSADGARIIFTSGRTGPLDLYAVASNGAGAEELLLTSELQKRPTSWSRDRRFVLFQAPAPDTGLDVWLLPLEGARAPVPVVQTTFSESEAVFSPNTRWIAFTSNKSGHSEIYVRPFDPAAPASGAADQVSKDGGRRPVWRNDGKELIYQGADGAILSVEVASEGALRPGLPKRLFGLPVGIGWDMKADAQGFLVAMPSAAAGLTPITVMINGASQASRVR